MTGLKLFVWESHSDLYGAPAPMEHIVNELKQFSCPSVLFLCSYISLRLQLGGWGDGFDEADYIALLSKMFPKETAEVLIDRLSSKIPRRRVFHRRLLLLTAKLAIIHCNFDGRDAANEPDAFGHIFLKLNDHFDFRAILGQASSMGHVDQLLCVLLHTLAMKEFASDHYDQTLVRSWRMCVSIPPTLKEHPDFVDIEELFRHDIGINYQTFEALAVGTSTKYKRTFRSEVADSPWMATILLDGFLTGGVVPIEQVRAFLDALSGSLSDLKLEAQRSPERNNDLSLFRKYPFVNLPISMREVSMLVRLLLDQDLLFEKLASTPYWMGVAHAQAGFPRFWGAIFETHLGQILQESSRGGPARYIHSPRLPATPGEEVCDGMMVSGNALVLLEYKSSILTAKAKYGGDLTELGNEIHKKLVRNEESGSPKAAVQLASAAKILLGASTNIENPWFEKAQIERCYAVVVTLDDIGGAGGISALLNVDFQAELSSCRLCCEIRPLFCVDVESLEVWSSVFEKQTFAGVLEQWFLQDPGMMQPLSSVRYAGTLQRPRWFDREVHALAVRVARILIDPARLVSDPNFQETVSSLDQLAGNSAQSGSDSE
jgi:hypothetical protein